MDTNEQPTTINTIIESAFDFSSYSEEEKASMIAETASMITEAALLRSLSEVGEDSQQAFQTMIEGNPSEEDMALFIHDHFPNFQEVLVSELQTFLNSEDASDIAPIVE